MLELVEKSSMLPTALALLGVFGGCLVQVLASVAAGTGL